MIRERLGQAAAVLALVLFCVAVVVGWISILNDVEQADRIKERQRAELACEAYRDRPVASVPIGCLAHFDR